MKRKLLALGFLLSFLFSVNIYAAPPNYCNEYYTNTECMYANFPGCGRCFTACFPGETNCQPGG